MRKISDEFDLIVMRLLTHEEIIIQLSKYILSLLGVRFYFSG